MPVQISLRNPDEVPSGKPFIPFIIYVVVMGLVGTIRKRNRSESMSMQETNEVKKSKKQSSEKSKKPSSNHTRPPATSSSSSTTASSAISRDENYSPSGKEERTKMREKKGKGMGVAMTTPTGEKASKKSSQSSDTTSSRLLWKKKSNDVDVEIVSKDIEPLKTSSDEPYVLMAADRQTAATAESNWKKVADRLTIPAVKRNEKNVVFWRKE